MRTWIVRIDTWHNPTETVRFGNAVFYNLCTDRNERFVLCGRDMLKKMTTQSNLGPDYSAAIIQKAEITVLFNVPEYRAINVGSIYVRFE